MSLTRDDLNERPRPENGCAKTAPVILALNIEDTAKALSVKPITVRRLVKRGLLRPNPHIRHLIFPVSEIERFLTGKAESN
jgi:Helix-turn-helix domain